MLATAWYWVFLILLGLIIFLVVLGTCLYFRRRVESIVREASGVADLSSQKQRLDSEIEQCMKSLELKKLEAEREKQESLKQALAKDLQEVVSAFKGEVADLTGKKQGLDSEIEQCLKTLDETREELRKFDGERQKQISLREDLAELSSQVAEEEKKRDEYRKEAEDLRNDISDLKQDLGGLAPEAAEEQTGKANGVSPLVKLRRVSKHKLRI